MLGVELVALVTSSLAARVGVRLANESAVAVNDLVKRVLHGSRCTASVPGGQAFSYESAKIFVGQGLCHDLERMRANPLQTPDQHGCGFGQKML